MKDKVLYLLPAMVTAFLVIFSVGSTGGFGEGDIYLVLALAIASSCFVPVLAEIVESSLVRSALWDEALNRGTGDFTAVA